MKNKNGDYADLVYFESLSALDDVVKAEKHHPAVQGFFDLIAADSGEHAVYEVLKIYG
jgi:hypothetical protein